jgi:hypothetical protein
MKDEIPEAIEWPLVGLPESFLALIAPGRCAFIPEGESTVAHGGACIEEVIVPLVHVERRSS